MGRQVSMGKGAGGGRGPCVAPILSSGCELGPAGGFLQLEKPSEVCCFCLWATQEWSKEASVGLGGRWELVAGRAVMGLRVQGSLWAAHSTKDAARGRQEAGQRAGIAGGRGEDEQRWGLSSCHLAVGLGRRRKQVLKDHELSAGDVRATTISLSPDPFQGKHQTFSNRRCSPWMPNFTPFCASQGWCLDRRALPKPQTPGHEQPRDRDVSRAACPLLPSPPNTAKPPKRSLCAAAGGRATSLASPAAC